MRFVMHLRERRRRHWDDTMEFPCCTARRVTFLGGTRVCVLSPSQVVEDDYPMGACESRWVLEILAPFVATLSDV